MGDHSSFTRLDASCLGVVSRCCIVAHKHLLTSSLYAQLDQLPEDTRAALRDHSLEKGQVQAMDEYNRRFVTQRPDASCLNAASSGQSATVTAALTGSDPFQV